MQNNNNENSILIRRQKLGLETETGFTDIRENLGHAMIILRKICVCCLISQRRTSNSYVLFLEFIIRVLSILNIFEVNNSTQKDVDPIKPERTTLECRSKGNIKRVCK